VHGRVARFEPGIEETLTAGDQFANAMMARIDDFVAEHGLAVGDDEEHERGAAPTADVSEIDLRDSGITAILWASGFRPDYSWIELDLTDEYGWPVQRRGVTSFPGLYFVGVNWLHKRKSALFCGVGEDAEHVVSQLVAR
jgi:putative flavoprotein involved in K+ transport